MRRLYTRIYFHFLAVLILVAVASSIVLAAGWRRDFVRNWTERLARMAALMVAAENMDPPRQQRVIRRLAKELDLDVTFRASNGSIRYTVGDELPMPDGGVPARVEILHRGKVRGFFVATPVTDAASGETYGVLLASPSHRFAPATMLWRPIVQVALALVIIALAVAPLARRLSRPVERLTEASRRLGNGELSFRVPLRQRKRHRLDEMDNLTRAWNDMADRVERMVHGQRELMANVSHELRSPLARMRVALELLPDTGEAAPRVASLREDLGELDRLIEDVLTTARLESAGLPKHLAPVEIAGLLEGLRARAHEDPATAAATVEIVPGAALDAQPFADAALLKRALWNLVENAAKYGQSPITLDARVDGNDLRIVVGDRGAGVPVEDRERVFDPFYRADRARTPGVGGERAGYGLGLTLARRVAEAHGGRISLGAHLDGVGCVITLTLPLADRRGSPTTNV
jgi:signal transduction histidine kinase